MQNFLPKMMQLVKDEEGATMVEYAIMLALIALVCIGTVKLVGESADAVFSNAELHMALGSE